MKIKLLVSIASASWSYSPGQIAEIDDEEAKRLINAGLAKKLDDTKPEGYPKHLGGGYYELPNGKRVRGKEKAIKAMRGVMK